MSTLFQVINSLIIILILGIPLVIGIVLFKKFADKPMSNEDYLLEKIRELENRIKDLEDNK